MFLRCLAFVAVAILGYAQSNVSIGQGAPTEAIRQRFVTNYNRGRFPSITSLPPLTTVSSFGGTGYIQEFPDLTKNAGLRHALIVGNAIVDSEGFFVDTYQVFASMYAYYISGGLGFTNLGFPISDTDIVEIRDSSGAVIRSYQYQFFQRSYALFVWSAPPDVTSTNTNFALREPYFSRWRALGQLGGLGAMTSAETSVTRDTISATQVNFEKGFLFNPTTGPSAGRLVTVRQPIHQVYVDNGGPAGRLGLPLNDELQLANGRRRQTFQNGSIEYGVGETPVVRNGVFAVTLTSVGSVRLNLNDTLVVRTQIVTNTGESVNDREVSWTTSNSRVIQIAVAPNQTGTATLRAVGGGSAFVTATSEGRTSAPLTVFVSAPCCAVGEGAPTAALQQTFQDAIARNRLTPRLPSPSPVQRFGAGYVQEFVAAESGVRFLLAKPDSSSVAYLLSGGLLTAYEAAGGFGGPLGYPASDPSATGRQLFENQAALAGDPVRVVDGIILGRWAQLGYETGTLGNPTSGVSRFLTFNATAGRAQSFRSGIILVAETGAQANRAYYAIGPIAAKYAEIGGPLGAAGLPLSDEFQIGTGRRQEFEGVTFDYTPGENLVRVTQKSRRPTVVSTPSTVVAGNRLRLSVGGFEEGAQLRISITGQPDFVVSTTSGSYAWDAFVPATARSGAVTVRAVALGAAGATPAAAEATYQVRALSDIRFTLAKLRGDTQTGPPGAVLPVALRVSLRDEFGSPVVNSPVRFNPSPGGAIAQPNVFTNDQGEAETQLRLPAGEGVALATAEAGRQTVTFSFRVAAQSLNNFPRLTQNSEDKLGNGQEPLSRKGALVAAAASVLRFYQGRGELAQPNGPADPVVLNQFLRDACVFDGAGNKICDAFLTPGDAPSEQVLNPWRLGAFTGGGVDVAVAPANPEALRDLVAAGSPVILALALTWNGAPVGSHFVVATGIDGVGNALLHDPSPALNRTSLADYLNGFTNAAGTWRGTLTGAFRLLPRAPAAGQFLVQASAAVGLASAAGPCGATLEFPQVAAVPGGAALANAPSLQRFRACTAAPTSAEPFQLDLTAAGRAVVTDLGQPAQRVELTAAAAAAYRVSRPNGAALLVAAQTLSARADQVVNAASFSRLIAPGTLITIFGAGLAGAGGGNPTVEVDGVSAPVNFASPFQINAQVPPAASPGTSTLRIRSPFGTLDQPLVLAPVAPAIFLLGGGLGAVVNQDGQINASTAPAQRGQVVVAYGTGFGATRAQGQLQVAVAPLTATLDDRLLTVNYAGLTPGIIGLNQANLLIPNDLPPSLNYRLVLRQGAAESNSVPVAVQ